MSENLNSDNSDKRRIFLDFKEIPTNVRISFPL